MSEKITFTIPISPGSLVKNEIKEVLESLNVKVIKNVRQSWTVSAEDPEDIFWLGMNLNLKLWEKEGNQLDVVHFCLHRDGQPEPKHFVKPFTKPTAKELFEKFDDGIDEIMH